MKVYFYILLLGFVFCSCSEDYQKFPSENELDNEDIDTIETKVAGEVVIYDSEKVQDGYVLVNDASHNRVYLIEKSESRILYEWNLPSGIGNDAELLDDGNLLVALTVEDPAYSFGGFGGRMAIIAPTGEIIWDYTYSDEVNLSHHDLEMLPNGNVLFLAWEKKEREEIVLNGYAGEEEEIYAEKLIEIDPTTNKIVWEWNSWDHLVQDVNPNMLNYGIVKDNPGRIDINYKDSLHEGSYNGDVMHANGLEYDENRDLIYLSVNYFSEVWVIDHSTTPTQATASAGGRYNLGGELVFRFGNPYAYKQQNSKRLFYHNHNPNLVEGGGSLLVFSNGIPVHDAHSVVYEFRIPDSFNMSEDSQYELDILWSYKDDELFSAKVSGAYRLTNGNTLITEGTSGYWEVTPSKELVWRFEADGFFWRGYPYEKNSQAIINLGL